MLVFIYQFNMKVYGKIQDTSTVFKGASLDFFLQANLIQLLQLHRRLSLQSPSRGRHAHAQEGIGRLVEWDYLFASDL